jgi:hypoxanthine phosphoribosyltransferase
MDQQSVVLKKLINSSKIKRRVRRLVKTIVEDYRSDELIVVGLLKGSFMFLADLVRQFHLHRVPIVVDFMGVSSYGSSTRSSGKVSLIRELSTDIRGGRVLLVDDILDTGLTLSWVYEHLLEHEPSMLKTCVLLEKIGRRKTHFEADYVGFHVPNTFVVGYGLDYDSRYRELPHISQIILPDEGETSDPDEGVE